MFAADTDMVKNDPKNYAFVHLISYVANKTFALLLMLLLMFYILILLSLRNELTVLTKAWLQLFHIIFHIFF